MSDFHEMVNYLKAVKSKPAHAENPGYRVDNGGRRLGFERRQFNYSHYFPERRDGAERRSMPERRIDAKRRS